MNKRVWLIEPPTDSPAPAQLVTVFEDGTVVTGTVEQLAEDIDSSIRDDRVSRVAQVWQWTPRGPVRLIIYRTDVPEGGGQRVTIKLVELHTARVAATTSWVM